jgi:hypothetical protein
MIKIIRSAKVAIGFMLTLLFTSGCAMFADSKKYPAPSPNFSAKGNQIFSGDTLFAEVRTVPAKRSDGLKGLAIYYHTHK